MAEQELAGKIAVVTGGSNGIGAATVRLLAAAGATVAICFNQGKQRAEALRGELPGEGHRALPLELTDTGSVRRLADAVREAYGRVDVLVNSAGMTRPIPHADLEALDEAFFDQVLIANARGPYSVIRALLPSLRAAAPSVVVNVSSVAAFNGAGSNIAYGAAKAALDTMTMSLARALGPDIRFMCVSPGPVATDFVAGRGREQIEKIMATAPLRRVIEAEDVGRAIMACVTHLGSRYGNQDRGGRRADALRVLTCATVARRQPCVKVACSCLAEAAGRMFNRWQGRASQTANRRKPTMQMRIVWGKILPGQWDSYKSAYKAAMASRGKVAGLVSQWLVRDQADPDAGYSVSVWENDDAMRAFWESSKRKETTDPLQKFFVNQYTITNCDVRWELPGA